MLNWLWGRRSISERLNPTKRVRLHGIVFTIRKLNPLDYFAGAKALQSVHVTYEDARKADKVMITEAEAEKVKTHYRDTLLKGVVSVRCMGRDLIPTLKEVKAGEDKIAVDNLLTDWSLAEELYLAIVQFTYGKKKLSRILSSARSS